MKFSLFILLLFFSLNSFAGLLTPSYCRELTLTNGDRGDAYFKAIKEVDAMVAQGKASKSFVKKQKIGSDIPLKVGDITVLNWKGGRANMNVKAQILDFCADLNDDYCVGVVVKMVDPKHEMYNGPEISPRTRQEMPHCWPLNLLDPIK